MKFEDALGKMRTGAKITHPSFDDDVYFMACRVGFVGMPEPWPLDIIKMKGDDTHEDMGRGKIEDDFYPGTLIFTEEAKKKIFNPCKHGHFPQLNLLLVMSEEWELWESESI